MGFAAFAGHKYLNLETLKKSGDGVKTPVWFAADPSASLDSNDAKLYVYTIGVSGKVKSIRNNPRRGSPSHLASIWLKMLEGHYRGQSHPNVPATSRL